MTDEQKQTFIDEYNAAELLHDMSLIDKNIHRKIEHTLLRTIIGHLAIECNKMSKILTRKDSDKENDWHDVPADEMTLEQARAAVKDLRKKLAEVI
jgi:hypothetical protein